MLVEMCKGRARCASFINLYVLSRRERFIAAAEDPASRVLPALLPEASIRISNPLHRVYFATGLLLLLRVLTIFTNPIWGRRTGGSGSR
jgi:hypothetical protein